MKNRTISVLFHKEKPSDYSSVSIVDHVDDFREPSTFVCFCLKGKTFSRIIKNTVQFYLRCMSRLSNSNHGGGGAHDQFNERKWKRHDSFHLCSWVTQSFQFESGNVLCWCTRSSTCSCIQWIYLLNFFFSWHQNLIISSVASHLSKPL